jgi:hypothetical protein
MEFLKKCSTKINGFFKNKKRSEEILGNVLLLNSIIRFYIIAVIEFLLMIYFIENVGKFQ